MMFMYVKIIFMVMFFVLSLALSKYFVVNFMICFNANEFFFFGVFNLYVGISFRSRVSFLVSICYKFNFCIGL